VRAPCRLLQESSALAQWVKPGSALAVHWQFQLPPGSSTDYGSLSVWHRFELMWNVFVDAPRGTPVAREDRDKAKRSIYGILYGQGAQGLASKLGISKTAAEQLMGKMHAKFPGIRLFIRVRACPLTPSVPHAQHDTTHLSLCA